MSVPVRHRGLPEIPELKKRLDTLAALDIILLDEENSWLRIHNKIPDPDERSSAYKIDNGAGDTLFIVFSEDGCVIKGFDHESPLSPYARDEFKPWPGIYDEVPENLLRLLNDPMIEREAVTFCVWRGAADAEWKKGNIEGNIENPEDEDDGFNFLMAYLCVSAEDCVKWANNYLDKEYPVEIVERIYAGEKVDESMVRKLNPERDARMALAEIESCVGWVG